MCMNHSLWGAVCSSRADLLQISCNKVLLSRTQFQIKKVLPLWREDVEKNLWETKVKRLRDDNIRQSIGKNGCP